MPYSWSTLFQTFSYWYSVETEKRLSFPPSSPDARLTLTESSLLKTKLGEIRESCVSRLLASQTADSAWEDARTVVLDTLSLLKGNRAIEENSTLKVCVKLFCNWIHFKFVYSLCPLEINVRNDQKFKVPLAVGAKRFTVRNCTTADFFGKRSLRHSASSVPSRSRLVPADLSAGLQVQCCAAVLLWGSLFSRCGAKYRIP